MGIDVVPLGRAEFADAELMRRRLDGVDSVIHLAGVNRATDEEIASGNRWLAQRLAAVADGRPVVYGNSIQVQGRSVFGDSKRAAADILAEATPLVDVVIPNVFGEHGRPRYNSFVATFCDALAHGGQPTIIEDRTVPLVHAQRVASVLLAHAVNSVPGRYEIEGRPTAVSEVLRRLQDIARPYDEGVLPDLSDTFTRDLFNTYRSHVFPSGYPIPQKVRSDARGDLVESLRVHGGQAQVFYSSTKPGQTRGQHYHLHKVERFMVIAGTGQIRLRRLLSDEVVAFDVTGEEPCVIDMPTMWVHSLVNTGDSDMVTLFYADELLDPAHPDTYPEDV